MEIFYFILGVVVSFLLIQGKAAQNDSSSTNVFSSDGTSQVQLESSRGGANSNTSASIYLQATSTFTFNDLSETTLQLSTSNNIDSSSAFESSITPQLSEAQTRSDIPTSKETSDFSVYTNTPVLENIGSSSRTESSITFTSSDYDIATSSQEIRSSTGVKDSSSLPAIEGTASSIPGDATEIATVTSDIQQQSVVISSETISDFFGDIPVTSSSSVNNELSTSDQTLAVSSQSGNILQTAQLETSSAYTKRTPSSSDSSLEAATGVETQLLSSSSVPAVSQDTSTSDIVDTQTEGLITPTKTSSIGEDATTFIRDVLSESQIVSSFSEGGDVSSSSFMQDLLSTDTFQRSSTAISQATYQTQSPSNTFVSVSSQSSNVDVSSELVTGELSSVVLSSVQSSTPAISSSQDLGNMLMTSDQIDVSTATDVTQSSVIQLISESSAGFEGDVSSTSATTLLTVFSSSGSDLISTPRLDVIPSSQSASVLQSEESSLFIKQSSATLTTDAISSAYYHTITLRESLDLYISKTSSSVSLVTTESITETTSTLSVWVSEVSSYPSESQSQTSLESSSLDVAASLISLTPSSTLSDSLVNTRTSDVIPTDLASMSDILSLVAYTEDETFSSPGISQTFPSQVYSDTSVIQSSESVSLSVSLESRSKEPSVSFQAHETDIISTYTLSVAGASESGHTSSSILFSTESSMYEASLMDTVVPESNVFGTESLSTFPTASSASPSYLPPVILESLTESSSSEMYSSSSMSSAQYFYSSETESFDTTLTMFSSQLVQTSSYISGITASSLMVTSTLERSTSIFDTTSSELTSAPIISLPTVEQSSSQTILASFESVTPASASSQTAFTSRDQSVSTQPLFTDYASPGSYTLAPTISSLGETSAFSDVTLSIYSDLSSMVTEQESSEVTSVSLTSEAFGPVLPPVSRTVVQSVISETIGPMTLSSTPSDSFRLPSSVAYDMSTSPSSGLFSQSSIATEASVSGASSSPAGDIFLPSLTTESSLSAIAPFSPSESGHLLTSTGTLLTVSSASEGIIFEPTISLETHFTLSGVESVVTSSSEPSLGFIPSSSLSFYPQPPSGILESSLHTSTSYATGSSMLASQESVSASYIIESSVLASDESVRTSYSIGSSMFASDESVSTGYSIASSMFASHESESTSYSVGSSILASDESISTGYSIGSSMFASQESVSINYSIGSSILASDESVSTDYTIGSSILASDESVSTGYSIGSSIFASQDSVSISYSIGSSIFASQDSVSTGYSTGSSMIASQDSASLLSSSFYLESSSTLIFPALSSESAQTSLSLESPLVTSRFRSLISSSSESFVVPSMTFTPSSSFSSFYPQPPFGSLGSSLYHLSILPSSLVTQVSESNPDSSQTSMLLESSFTASGVESTVISSTEPVIILPSLSFTPSSSVSSYYPIPPSRILESSFYASTSLSILPSSFASQVFESSSLFISTDLTSAATSELSSVTFPLLSSEHFQTTMSVDSLFTTSGIESVTSPLSIFPSSFASQVFESSSFFISTDLTSAATSELSSVTFPPLSSEHFQTTMSVDSLFTTSGIESVTSPLSIFPSSFASQVFESSSFFISTDLTSTATSELSSVTFPPLSSEHFQTTMSVDSLFTTSGIESVTSPLSIFPSSFASQVFESSSFFISTDLTSTATSELSSVTFPPLSSEHFQTTMSVDSLFTTSGIESVTSPPSFSQSFQTTMSLDSLFSTSGDESLISSSSESIILPSLSFTPSSALSTFYPLPPSRILESSTYASTDLYSSITSSQVESMDSLQISSMTFLSTESATFVVPTTVLSSDILPLLSSDSVYESLDSESASISSDSVIIILPTSILSSDFFTSSSERLSESASIATSGITSAKFSDISSVVSDLSTVPQSIFSSYTGMLPSSTPYFTSTGVVSLESRSSTDTVIQSEMSTLVPSFESTRKPSISTGYLSLISTESGRSGELTSFISSEFYTSLQPGSFSSQTVESSIPAPSGVPSVSMVTSSLKSASRSALDVSSLSSSVLPTPTPVPTTMSSLSMSSSVLPTTSPTTPPATTPSLNTSEALKEFWVVTVVKVRRSEDVTSDAFKSNIQSKLASVYQDAFTRQELIKNGTYEPLKRRKRYATSPDGSVKLQVVDVQRESGSNTKLTYLAEKDGKMVPADTMVDTLGLLDDQEVALGLGYVVSTKAEPYVPVPVTPAEDRKLWIIAAVLGPLVLILLIWIIVCVSCRFCCNRKHVTGEEPHLMKVRRDGNHVESEFGASDGAPDYPPEQGGQRSNGIGLIKSGTKKMSYDVNPEPDDEAALYPEVKKPVEAARLPKKKKHPSPSHQSTGGDSVVYVSEEDHQTTPVKKRGKKLKPVPAEAEDSQSPVENMVEPYHHAPRSKPLPVPRAVKPTQSDPLPTAEEEDELVERAEMERLRNKQRLREQRKRDKQNNTGSTRSRNHSGKDGYRKAQKEIDAVLGSADHDDNLPDVFVHKPKKRSSRHTKEPKEGHSNEAFTEDEHEGSSQSGESLEEAKRRMHRLLDDAFSLISSSRSSIGNKVSHMDSPEKGLPPPEGQGREENVTPRSNGHIPAESKESKPQIEEKKHTPMFLNPTFSGKDDSVSGLETWSPYRAADEVALISLPQTQTVLDKTPTQERLQTTTFNESYPTSMRDSYYTTEPAKPIVIRTKDLPADGQDDTNSFRTSNSRHQKMNGIGTGQGTGGLPNGDASYPGMKGYEDIPLHSVSGKSRTHDEQRENGDVPHRAPVKTWAGQDEVDIVSSLEPGASPRPFIRSLREELEHLSTRVGENPETDTKRNALAQQ